MNTEEHNEALRQELLDITRSLTGLYDAQIQERRIEAFREKNEDFKDSPKEWIEPFLNDEK